MKLLQQSVVSSYLVPLASIRTLLLVQLDR